MANIAPSLSQKWGDLEGRGVLARQPLICYYILWLGLPLLTSLNLYARPP